MTLDLARAFAAGVLATVLLTGNAPPTTRQGLMLFFTVMPVFIWELMNEYKEEKAKPKFYDREKENWFQQ